MAKPINFTMFVEIFSIIGGILSTISGSMFQTITFFPSLVNYVVLTTITPSTIFFNVHIHFGTHLFQTGLSFYPPPLLYFFMECLKSDILYAFFVKYFLTFFSSFVF